MDDFLQPSAKLMLNAFRHFEEHLLTSLPVTDLTLADITILRHLDPEGMTVTALAADIGVSKQAVSRSLVDLEAKNYIFTLQDVEDRRARKVLYTKKGHEFIHQAIQQIKEFEQAYEHIVGKDFYPHFRRSLLALAEWHQQKMESDHAEVTR